MQSTGSLQRRHLGPPARGLASPASLAAVIASIVAMLLVVASFGILSVPPAAIGMLLASRGRRELTADSGRAAQRFAALAWWMSVAAFALSAAALLLLVLDLAHVGGVADQAVEQAH
jgi:hypothetical protein